MMNSNEWPLIFFTLFSQISVGMVVCVMILAASFRKRSLRAITALHKAILLTSLAFMGVALLISFLHLTQPLHAMHALDGIKTSWLSREILLASVFLCLLAASYLSLHFRLLIGKHHLMLLSVTALAGLLLIYTMVRLYMLPTIPAWDHASTPVSFFNTALLAGSATTLAITAFNFHRGMEPQAFASLARILAGMAIAGIIIHAVNGIFLIPEQATHARDAVIFLPELAPAIWKLARCAFLAIGSASLMLWLLRYYNAPTYASLLLVCLAADCFLLAEVCARYLFYASYYRIGV